MTAKLGAERTMRQKPDFKNVVGRLLPIQRPFSSTENTFTMDSLGMRKVLICFPCFNVFA